MAPVLLLLFCLLPTRSAHAYLEAGTGSIIIQALIAGFVGALFAIKIFWKKIRAFLGKLFSRGTKDEAPDN